MYEVQYTYFERADDGTYNTDEAKTLTKKYGKKFDDVPVEKVATTIMTALARRDIWITDVKVYEYAKKELKFKEIKGGGIALGSKKFQFGSGQALVAEDDEPVAPPPQMSHIPQQMQSPTQALPAPSIQGKRPLKHVVFNPPPELRQQARVLRCTVGQKYAVFEEKATEQTNAKIDGMMTTAVVFSYLIVDDLNRSVWARSFYFEDMASALTFEDQMVDSRRPTTTGFIDSVQYDGGNFDMDIRRR